MGTILPDNPADQLTFFETHAPRWAEAPSAVGLSEEEAVRVQQATERAKAALAAARAAASAARSATQNWKQAARELRVIGGHAIGTIKAYARTTGDGTVLAEAGLSPPEKPGPKRAGAPRTAADFPRVRWTTASPDSYGNIEVEWTCGVGATMGAGPGVFYRLQRQLDGGPITMLEMVHPPGPGRRSVKFLDTTVPFGTRQVHYFVTPVKGAGSGTPGPSATVSFGGPDAPPVAPSAHEVHVRGSMIGTQRTSAA